MMIPMWMDRIPFRAIVHLRSQARLPVRKTSFVRMIAVSRTVAAVGRPGMSQVIFAGLFSFGEHSDDVSSLSGEDGKIFG
jgi:hypothetical protein